MKTPPSNRRPQRTVDDEAAGWVVRQERGFTATEQDALSQWLAMDPRHRAAFAEQRKSWEELDRLNGLQSCIGAVPDPKLLAPHRSVVARWTRITLIPLALAAALVMMVYLVRRPAVGPSVVESRALPALAEERKLSDGSLLALNRGASVTVSFTAFAREVRLDHGEAHFTVAHESDRPFVVETAGVAVHAVGTAFSVLRDRNSVSVLVTEGKVKVLRSGSTASATPPVVSAGQRAVVSLATDAPAPTITPISPAEIEVRLAWRPRLLDFEDATLAEITAEFNRRNPVRLTIGDPAISSRRLSASIRSNNLEGFLKLLETDYGILHEQRGQELIELKLAR